MFARNLLLLLFCAVSIIPAAQTTSRLIPKKGIFLTSNKLTWTSGSEINILTPDRKNHHYYFTWWEQDIDTARKGRDVLLIGSENTAIHGTYSLQQKENVSRSFIDCEWNLYEPAVADIVYANLWLPFFHEAKWSNSQKKKLIDLSSFNDTLLIAETPFGNFQFRSSHPFKIKKKANLHPAENDYTHRSQYLILYTNNIPVNQLTGLHRSFFIEETAAVFLTQNSSVAKTITLEKVTNAWQSTTQQHQILPQPKSIQLIEEQYIVPISKPSVVTEVVTAFRNILQLHWQIGNSYYPTITTKQSNSFNDEAYTIDIKQKHIEIEYKTKLGLQHALQTLAQLTNNENGKLVIPQGHIQDEPSVSWRGIHMFTGSASWKLHRTMYDRILLPLKMNKVVLQCEQAEWRTRPEVHNSISVPLKDLKAEFDYLRKNNCEPIPLIQSLGHMEWFFKPQQNRFMAVNPQYPYTLNPDLPQAKQAIKQLWDEAFALLKPTTMHIGFDEIGMIGFNQPKEKEVDYFKTQINFLHNYAKQKKATLMLWGDMGLAPGEGPDALNGVTKERAVTIRSFIPAGSYVADWHYINDANPEIYKQNLNIWKQNKNLPLASPWLGLNNVKGFVQAAIDEQAGVLQTTWADFESSEKNMLLNIEQFGAYILAMDYAWSGRKEMPKDLPYNAIEEWTSRFYAQPKPISNRNGFRITESLQFENITAASKINLPVVYNLKWNSIQTSGFQLKATTETILPEGTPVAVLQFFNNNQLVYEKEIQYAVDVRSKMDKRKIFACTPGKNEKTLFQFFQKQFNCTSINIRSIHPASGLNVEELVIIH